MTTQSLSDGVHAMVPREKMCESARKLRDNYGFKSGAPLLRRTFGLWQCLDHWYEQGLDLDADLAELFMFDLCGHVPVKQLGWETPALEPAFEKKVVEDRGDYEVVQDAGGRYVLFFKGHRHDYMPQYIEHPVKDMKTWQDNVKWRLSPTTTSRYTDTVDFSKKAEHNELAKKALALYGEEIFWNEKASLTDRMNIAVEKAGKGMMIQQMIIGAYMYLRSLIGPEELLYFFYDKPDVIHDCMKTWLELADTVTARHQEYVTFDEVFFGEDICYNHGPLISPDMIKEFLFPYYQQLLSNIKSRQIDKQRHLYIHIDSDGHVQPIINLYQQAVGMNMMSPFEVASGCDIIQIGKSFPEMVMMGGVDKRILMQDKKTIDKYLERVIPVMRERSGYILTCDHGVPPEVKWENYLYFRERCVELGG